MGRQLSGMKEICQYVRRSESTIVHWESSLAMPIEKMDGKQWDGDTDKIDEWRMDMLGGSKESMQKWFKIKAERRKIFDAAAGKKNNVKRKK